MFDLAVACLVATALLSYANARLLRLPQSIGVMAIALLLSLLLVALDMLDISDLRAAEEGFLKSIDFTRVLMDGMLSLLLFAGALHVDMGLLRRMRGKVALLAVVGTLLSTAIVGFALWWALPQLGLPLSLAWCLVFGALISPTDPIAVMGMMKESDAPAEIEILVSGESLFNDGVAVVLFSLLLGVAIRGTSPDAGEVGMALLREAGGGLALGAALGGALYLLLRSIDDYQVEVLLTLATVLGGYQLAQALHVSGPLAMVVAGLLIGNQGRAEAMSDTTRERVDMFWELLDSILNAVLFVLLGMEFVLVPLSPVTFMAGVVAIVVVLAARVLAVGLPVGLVGHRIAFPHGAALVLTWGSLRGGISVALALALPAGPARDIALGMTYAVVLFSVLVQGMSFRRVLAMATR